MAKRKIPIRDVYKEGISVTWLKRFITCRERFRLGYILSMREKGSKEAIDFGSIFHKLIEFHAQGLNKGAFTRALSKWQTKQIKKRKADAQNWMELGQLALTLFHRYIDYHKDTKHEYFSSEEVFKEPYTLNSGRTLFLRGRMDEIIQLPNGKLLLQENKTHGQFDREEIIARLPKDLQTMFYCTAIQLRYGITPAGVLYNVARKPQLRQGVKESFNQYIERVDKDIESRPDWYFFRHQHDPKSFPHDLEQWQLRTLNPNLEAVCEWWESIRANPLNPWVIQGPNGELLANPNHWERPFGIYDNMTLGKGDFYDYLVKGSNLGIEFVNDIFPELEEDD